MFYRPASQRSRRLPKINLRVPQHHAGDRIRRLVKKPRAEALSRGGKTLIRTRGICSTFSSRRLPPPEHQSPRPCVFARDSIATVSVSLLARSRGASGSFAGRGRGGQGRAEQHHVCGRPVESHRPTTTNINTIAVTANAGQTIDTFSSTTRGSAIVIRPPPMKGADKGAANA